MNAQGDKGISRLKAIVVVAHASFSAVVDFVKDAGKEARELAKQTTPQKSKDRRK